ncbi:BLUF domain-containing protein [Aureimonas sp. AU4]|uniref:BLUF domain-containing protein n=1 Tax=Aureimonas sp. AU4 TaxID=1638163 RepID=UPI000781DF8D|nr:BLUF domain-containing protein [Aureimonas sp. AU4]
MTADLHRLVYYSRNHVEGTDATLDREIGDILAKSQHNNRRDGITGALLFNAGCFAQVLEGPLGAVEAAFERIQQDERHGDVSLLALERIEARSFPNWAMGFVGASQHDAGRFDAIGSASGFDPARLDGEAIHSLLRDLAVEEEGIRH